MANAEAFKVSHIQKEYEEYIKTSNLDILRKNYIIERLIRQITWYDEQSQAKQKRYKICMIISIVATAIIPILSLFTSCKYGIIATIIIAILSSGSVAIISISNLCQYQQLWLQYRPACEILKGMLHRFFTGTEEFSNKNDVEKFNILVSSSEKYMTKEYETWTKLSHTVTKEA